MTTHAAVEASSLHAHKPKGDFPSRSSAAAHTSVDPAARKIALTSYSRNSPAAIARVVALAMLADVSIDTRELDAIDALGVLQELGMERETFLAICSECFAEAMMDMRAHDRMTLIDDALVDRILADLDDPQACATAYRAALALLPADGRLSPEELAVLQRMFDRWSLSRETLTAGLS